MAKKADIFDAWYLPEDDREVLDQHASEPEPIAENPVARAISQGKAARPSDEPVDEYIEDPEMDDLPMGDTTLGKPPKKKARGMSGEPAPRPWRPTEAEMKMLDPVKAQKALQHMMKYRVGVLVGVRCGIVFKIDASLSQMEQGIVAWEPMVTCTACKLEHKSEWEPADA